MRLIAPSIDLRDVTAIEEAIRAPRDQPLVLKNYATADLPAAADWAYGLAYNATVGGLTLSNGSAWLGIQPLNANLTALGGLTSAADKLPYFTGSGAAAVTTFTAFGRSLVDDADATAARATLGLTTGTTAGTVPLNEEGTFTPVMDFGGSQAGFVFSVAEGAWVKIGRLVTVNISIVMTTKGSGVGVASIGTLPFTAAGASTRIYVADTHMVNLTTVTAGRAFARGTGTGISLSDDNSGTNNPMTSGHFNNDSEIYLTLTYFI